MCEKCDADNMRFAFGAKAERRKGTLGTALTYKDIVAGTEIQVWLPRMNIKTGEIPGGTVYSYLDLLKIINDHASTMFTPPEDLFEDVDDVIREHLGDLLDEGEDS